MIPSQTLVRFIREQERSHPKSTGELSSLLASIALGVKIISQMVATAGFKGLTGYSGRENIHEEQTRILDDEADRVLVELLSTSGHFGLLVSEERDDVIAADTRIYKDAKYIVAFDPLDGSSNIGSNIPVGTIFTIFRRASLGNNPTMEDFLQPGTKLIAAGYSVYGAKTSFVYSTGHGAHDFTLDPTIGEFILTEEKIVIPKEGNIYSTNEGYTSLWSEEFIRYVNSLKGSSNPNKAPYTSRYVGSLVADFDRTIRKGGIFLYPPNNKHKNGKLRLLYEVMPLSYIAEQAGAISLDGSGRVLDIVPTDIHQRAGLVVGSPREIDFYKKSLSIKN